MVGVVERRDDARQRVCGVFDGAAVAPRMEVEVGAGDADLDVGQAAQRIANRRDIALEEGAVTDDRNVGAQAGPVGFEPTVEVLAPRFLLALEDEFQVQRQPARGTQERLGGRDVHVHLGFVVAGAAGIDPAVFEARLERRADPQLERLDGLDVVVGVRDDGRRSRRAEPLAVDHRVTGGLGDLDRLETGATEARRDPLRTGARVRIVGRHPSDAREAQELDEVGETRIGRVDEEALEGRVERAGHDHLPSSRTIGLHATGRAPRAIRSGEAWAREGSGLRSLGRRS